MNIIAATDVYKSFGETKALAGCTFSARPGEIHAIVGENGCGKSTLSKVIAGVHAIDKGTVSVFGHAPRSPYEARKIGIANIFQEVMVAEEASILDNLFVGSDSLLTKRRSKQEKTELAQDIMRQLTGTDLDLGRLVLDLPLSVKQWIVIGRALLSNPKVLIFDESSAALDLDGMSRLHNAMRKRRDEGCCVIIVTHRIAELVKITDRATVLRDGRNVGVLEKHDINEKNLLALMTAKTRTVREQPVHLASPERKERDAVMVTKRIHLNEQAQAFDFSLGKGEIVGFTGLDGQGQDKFIRALCGIDALHSGAIEVKQDNGNWSKIGGLQDAERLRVAYVSGDRKKEGIFPNLSIFENFGIGLYRKLSSRAGWIDRAVLTPMFNHEVARFATKTGDRDNKITSLSGGNQQKVLISRAFATEPRILVLNDPARGVDLGTKRDLYEQLRKYAAAGGSVIYLSSELEEFFGFADRVVVFNQDRVFETLGAEDINEERILAAMFGQKVATDELRLKTEVCK